MATIYCFTSTGNSLYAAYTIADKIGATVLPMRGEPAVCEDDLIGFVFPCYFWGLPRIVERFVSDMRITDKDAYIFAVCTCGGSGYGVFGFLKKILRSKNIRLRFAARIQTVTNYLPGYEAKDSEALRRKVEARTHKIAEAVTARETNRILSLNPLNKLAYKLFPDENSDRHFSVAPSCTGCGTCRGVCPADNIVMVGGRPDFLHKCEHCLGCLHNCPTDAIDWKDKTQGKERYRNVNISLDELIAFNNRQSDK